jgi:hypothetical protein
VVNEKTGLLQGTQHLARADCRQTTTHAVSRAIVISSLTGLAVIFLSGGIG